MRTHAFVGVMAFGCIAAAPALADSAFVPRSQPKTLTAFMIGDRNVEVLAVSRRARADTALRLHDMEEARAMSKVMPGYPQPAVFSFDLRISF